MKQDEKLYKFLSQNYVDDNWGKKQLTNMGM